jgi:hypothetical protein
MKLFDEPFDVAAVETALADDDFHAAALAVTGIELNWREALDQVARLADLFDADGREWRPLYRLISILIQRAETFGDTGRFLDDLVAALGILPGTGMFEEIRMAHLHKTNPAVWQSEKNRAWAQGYFDQRKILAEGGRP